MKRSLLIILIAVISAVTALAQTASIDFWQFPDKVVQRSWEMGVRGELLTTKGWNTASGFYAKPNPEPQDKSFEVYSNFYGISSISIKGDQADILMEYDDGGRIDSNLHYSPPPKITAFKTAINFHLTLTPTYSLMFGPDGTTLIESKPTGHSAWKIEGTPIRPWTTVNTAVRYVLEMRNKTTDPLTRKNADETIAKLPTLH
jgi:hypothetical protein